MCDVNICSFTGEHIGNYVDLVFAKGDRNKALLF